MDQRFVERAQRYWTPDRLARVTGGKDLLVHPDEAPYLLRVMGLLNGDCSMSTKCVRKYRQINHMLRLIMTKVEAVARLKKPVCVLDACCGSSFLSLLLAWLFEEKLRVDYRVLGLDRNPQAIEDSRERVRLMGWGARTGFGVGTIDERSWRRNFNEVFPADSADSNPNILIALHACDTATDDALMLGVRLGSELIAVAPCCQAELARQWKDATVVKSPIEIFMQTPEFRRECAADATDAMRMLLMRSSGYDVWAREFVPSDHTPKNRLLICLKGDADVQMAMNEYLAFKNAMGGMGIGLESRLTGSSLKID